MENGMDNSPSGETGKRTVRVQYDLPVERLKDFEDLRKETGATSNREVMSTALALLQWSVREVKRGRSIASVDEANMKFKEIWMPALEHAASLRPLPGPKE